MIVNPRLFKSVQNQFYVIIIVLHQKDINKIFATTIVLGAF
jgi:hypothetical protein